MLFEGGFVLPKGLFFHILSLNIRHFQECKLEIVVKKTAIPLTITIFCLKLAL